MKKILTLLLLLCTLAASATDTEKGTSDFFKQYLNNPDYEVVYVSPAMIDLVKKNGVELDFHEIKASGSALAGLLSVEAVKTNKNVGAKQALFDNAHKIFSESNGYQIASLASDPQKGSYSEILTKKHKDGTWINVCLTQKNKKSSASVVIFYATYNLTNVN